MADMLTADGHIVTLRPVIAGDHGDLARLHHEATDHSRYLRFFSLGTDQIAAEVTRLTRHDCPDHYAVLARERGRTIGVASYERLDDPTRAEFSVLVADAWQGRGVGTLLPHGVVAVDVKLRIAAIGAEPDPTTRTLRS